MKNLFHSMLIAGIVFTTAISAQENTIKHTVKQGETLYSIAREYKVDVKQLFELNNISDREHKVKLGDVLIVSDNATTTVTKPASSSAAATQGNTTHEVKSGETLFKIARMYNTTPEAIKALNNLKSDGVNLGQVLNVPGASVANTYIEPAKPVTPIAPVSTKTLPQVTEEDKKEVINNKTTFATEYNKNEASYFDKGMAEWIDNQDENNGSKFYALHKTAPIGTVLKVRNLMNDKVAYVKVVGKLQDADNNKNTIVKVSGATAKYLEVIDPKFLVEISYVNKKN
jgi:LysM repeat protein